MSVAEPQPPTASAPTRATAAPSRQGMDWSNALLNGYMALFFLFMFAPLLIMVGAAFNDYPTPSITEWRGFTLRWFAALPQDARMMQGLLHSLMIAVGVLAISIPLGLSGAMVMSRLQSRANGVLYVILVSPILTPGIILGITTMIFWRDMFSVEAGLFTAMVAQASFISSYMLLMFMARLSRQDRTLDEAAADLGASPFLTFRRITLPFMMPTIVTASLIGFLQSIENYPTTFFSIGPSWTLVTEIGSRMRFGLSPMINAIGVIFIAITVVCAVTWALTRKREAH